MKILSDKVYDISIDRLQRLRGYLEIGLNWEADEVEENFQSLAELTSEIIESLETAKSK